MKIRNVEMKVSVLHLAVKGALVALVAVPVYAQAVESWEDEVSIIRHPTNYIELGVASISQGSSKFGEYNGLDKSGGKAVANFSVRGGDAYEGGDGIRRWAVQGLNLGTDSRSLSGSVGDQGRWSVGVGYDELRHNLSNTYMTPYDGSVGGNSFTLPSTFGLISTTASGMTPVGTDGLNATQRAALHQVDLYSTRKNTTLNAGVHVNEQWVVKFDFNRNVQSGGKLKGFGSMAAGTVSGEVVAMLPSPTSFRTDTMTLSANWVGEQAHFNTSYVRSAFHDDFGGVTFQTFGGASAIQTMSTAPSNLYQQLNLGGGYVLAPKTKLTAGYSISHNTQNDAFVYDSVSMVSAPPRASLDGKVVNTHFDLKLVDQTIKDLALSGSVKYDQRNNRTESYLYKFNALDGQANHVALFPNTPYSIKKTQMEVAADYRVSPDQHVRVAYNREDIKRWCDNYAVGGAGAYTAGQNYNNYPAGTNCVVATASKDDKLGALYKVRASEELNLNAGYSYSDRKTDSDPNAITARIGTNGNVDPAATASTLVWGQNAGDYRGFYPFFNASRKQQMLKAGANWQASEMLAFGLNGQVTDDKYDSTYGVKKGKSWSLSLDAGYTYSEDGSLTAYLTQQHKERDMTDMQRAPTQTASAASATAISVPSGATWDDKLKNDDTTVGLGAKQRGLMRGKLELEGDLSYSLGKSAYSTQLNYATTTTGGYTCASAYILSCGDLPVVKNKVVQLRLAGNYTLDKSSRVAIGYVLQKLTSDDYYYNGLQYGYTANTMMPTNQQAGDYTVFVVSATYVYNFK